MPPAAGKVIWWSILWAVALFTAINLLSSKQYPRLNTYHSSLGFIIGTVPTPALRAQQTTRGGGGKRKRKKDGAVRSTSRSEIICVFDFALPNDPDRQHANDVDDQKNPRPGDQVHKTTVWLMMRGTSGGHSG